MKEKKIQKKIFIKQPREGMFDVSSFIKRERERRKEKDARYKAWKKERQLLKKINRSRPVKLKEKEYNKTRDVNTNIRDNKKKKSGTEKAVRRG